MGQIREGVAIRVGNVTYTHGQEAELEAAIAAGATLDIEKLTAAGVLIGWDAPKVTPKTKTQAAPPPPDPPLIGWNAPKAAEDPEEDVEDAQGEAEGLPEGFPGREALQAAGMTTVAAVRLHPDLTEIAGIGPKTAKAIAEALEG